MIFLLLLELERLVEIRVGHLVVPFGQMEHPRCLLNFSGEEAWKMDHIRVGSARSEGSSSLANISALKNDPGLEQKALDQKSLIIYFLTLFY